MYRIALCDDEQTMKVFDSMTEQISLTMTQEAGNLLKMVEP